jgi:hypothetical protein
MIRCRSVLSKLLKFAIRMRRDVSHVRVVPSGRRSIDRGDCSCGFVDGGCATSIAWRVCSWSAAMGRRMGEREKSKDRDSTFADGGGL